MSEATKEKKPKVKVGDVVLTITPKDATLKVKVKRLDEGSGEQD